MSYQTAVDRLRELPAVFDLHDIRALSGVTDQAAAVYAKRWRDKDLIKGLGGRTGVFFNLVVDSTGPETRIAEAVEKLLARPVIAIGATALHQHGWTTQIPHVIELAVPVTTNWKSLPQAEGLKFIPRSQTWFQQVQKMTKPGYNGFRTLRPEIALVDAWISQGAPEKSPWNVAVDDLDLPDDAEALVENACNALRCTPQQKESVESRLAPALSGEMAYR